MSFILDLDEAKLDIQLPPLLEGFEADVEKAPALFQLEGVKLEKIMRDLPYHQQYYAHRAQEAKHIVKWLDNHLSKIEGRMTKNMLAGNQRAFAQRDQNAMIAGEREVVEHKQLIIEFSLMYGKLDEIVECFKVMGWTTGNMTKLHVASIQDVVL